jgi:putative nucleotidyltransferase with HDIG domain
MKKMQEPIRETMAIPSRTACYRLIRKMEMMDHIVLHSLQVCRVAMLLGEKLQHSGTVLNLKLVQAAALLHDITKTRSFDTGEKHSDTGCAYLTACGYPNVGNIVRQHVKLDHYFDSERPTEAEIVNYADKRVLHDRIVSLAERMSYILQRYGSSTRAQEGLRWLWEKSILQEKRIFSDLPFGPEQLTDFMQETDLEVELQSILHDVDLNG